jgi:hypothetical protein
MLTSEGLLLKTLFFRGLAFLFTVKISIEFINIGGNLALSYLTMVEWFYLYLDVKLTLISATCCKVARFPPAIGLLLKFLVSFYGIGNS